MSSPGSIVYVDAAPAQHFLDSPLIVWRNVTRLSATHAIRKALGYPREALTVGEPLVCRSTNQEDRALGFFNNGLYRIVEVSTDEDPRHITVEDALGVALPIYVHLEELDGEGIYPKAIPFRFGYALTAHTAQGGEWSRVYISLSDLKKYAANCQRYGRTEDLARWSYTAITRAKDTLYFLRQEHFLTQEEVDLMASTRKGSTIAPTFIAPEDEAEMAPEPSLDFTPGDVPDDIRDPVVPPEAIPAAPAPVQASIPTTSLPANFGPHEALLHGFCEYLQGKMHSWLMEEHHRMVTGVDVTLAGIRDWAEKVFQANEHSQYQLSDALARLQTNGLTIISPPYQAVLHVTTPEGYALTLTVTKTDPDALVQELLQLENWLKAQGYQALERSYT